MEEELDQMTLARARRGDHAAFSVLVRRYQDRVYALVGRMLIGASRASVDDVAQDAFVRVLRGLPGFDPTGPARLSTWILTIATRTCLNALRDGRRHETAQPPTDDQTVAPEDPERSAADRQLQARVEAAMAALPPDMRAVLVLRAYHDCEYDEIAQALGTEIGTVKSRLARARAALRAAVED